MTSPREHRLYQVILKQVLWDEDETKIRKKFEVNEVPEKEANAIYQEARRERLQTIRKEYLARIGQGAPNLVFGLAIFWFFRFGVGFMHIAIWLGAGLVATLGLLKILNGCFGYVNASKHKGSVADDF